MTDQVNSPKHYTQGRFETIYEIADILGAEGFKAFCLGNAIKYHARASYKGLQEDLDKATQYLNWHVSGLPEPVNGRLPRIEKAEPNGANQAYDPRYEEKMARHAEASGQGPAAFDVYAQLAARMFDPTTLGKQEASRTTSKPETLAAGYGEAGAGKTDKPDPNKYPTARAVSKAMNPSFVKALGGTPVGYFLRVQRARCQEHEEHVWYIASIIRKEDNQQVIEMTILNNDPDEETLIEAGQALAYLFREYVA